VFLPSAGLGPATTTVAYAVVGVCLGTASGLTPGVHANAFALLLAAGADASAVGRLGITASETTSVVEAGRRRLSILYPERHRQNANGCRGVSAMLFNPMIDVGHRRQ
jgi:hypothetical protein